jgi:hypothetical protein
MEDNFLPAGEAVDDASGWPVLSPQAFSFSLGNIAPLTFKGREYNCFQVKKNRWIPAPPIVSNAVEVCLKITFGGMTHVLVFACGKCTCCRQRSITADAFAACFELNATRTKARFFCPSSVLNAASDKEKAAMTLEVIDVAGCVHVSLPFYLKSNCAGKGGMVVKRPPVKKENRKEKRKAMRKGQPEQKANPRKRALDLSTESSEEDPARKRQKILDDLESNEANKAKLLADLNALDIAAVPEQEQSVSSPVDELSSPLNAMDIAAVPEQEQSVSSPVDELSAPFSDVDDIFVDDYSLPLDPLLSPFDH